MNEIPAVALCKSINYLGGAIMISFPFLFVFLPFIVLSAMIIFAGKPGN
jgi:hypothetical protein